MAPLICFGALWLGISTLESGGFFGEWVWAYLLPGTWLATLPLIMRD